MGDLIHVPWSVEYPYPTPPSLSSTPARLFASSQSVVPEPEEETSSPVPPHFSSASEPSDEPALSSAANLDEKQHDEPRQTERDHLRAHLRHSMIKGQKPMRARTKFIGEVVDFPSPIDKTVNFGIRRLPNRDILSYRDKNAVVRFISEEGSERYIQEKEYPAGSMRVDTVQMGLATWNILDEESKSVEISRDAILDYLDPRELDAIYDKVMDVNPILSGREEEKNDSKND
jgi:hypothetical protein